MYPIKLVSPLKSYLWGGDKLKNDYNKQTELLKVAESWELACHKDGDSIILNGEYAGKTLSEYICEKGKTILGKNCEGFKDFPVLIKLIDAKDNLSVQVHPENEYALIHEGEYGKTEMWYIVECDEGASLLYGFKELITKEEFANHISDNTLLDVVNKVEVKKGDVFFIEAGTLHAIGKGILIAEIQQNSNTTYRVYDYGRVEADGNPRQLHVQKALDVTKLTLPSRGSSPQGEKLLKHGFSDTLLSACEYFTVHMLEIESEANFAVLEESFCSLLCLEGEFKLICSSGVVEFSKGDSIFLEANIGDCRVIGKGNVIMTTV